MMVIMMIMMNSAFACRHKQTGGGPDAPVDSMCYVPVRPAYTAQHEYLGSFFSTVLSTID